MQIIHRGLTIVLPDRDPRIVEVERVIFGGPLPLPPTEPAPQAPPVLEPEPAPAVEVPSSVRAWWETLDPEDRRELALLAARRYDAAELERALGISQDQLRGRHVRLSRQATAHGLPMPVRPHGRVRADRRYSIEPELERFVRALDGERAVTPPPPART